MLILYDRIQSLCLFAGEEAVWLWVFRVGSPEGAIATETGDIWSHQQNSAAPSQRAARIPGTPESPIENGEHGEHSGLLDVRC